MITSVAVRIVMECIHYMCHYDIYTELRAANKPWGDKCIVTFNAVSTVMHVLLKHRL